ncbi:linear amide C-N hydrolase [Bacteroides sp.]|uniref:linear amide C-N hydrolase n=1 Tax=Bacteroides sp. TaxID=29523 RepID=UPI002634085C|nr:linear amide C-N hydrolase [Bacteroides sp.]MDD3038697.1 linear amide C-N hydrolase [Bacteroides sp.]
MKKKLIGIALLLAAVSLSSIQTIEACTRAVYIGPEQMVITGRTMDWKEDIMSNIYVFPRGMKRAGHNEGETVNWTSKYGSVIATGYDIGTCDGMNEKGLVASLLFLPESVYSLPGDTRPAMGISIWTQYVLDNFATVSEAVDELKKETFRIDAPRMPNNGPESTLHLAITDATGNTAILEYIDGKLNIHEGKEYQVMTNSPRYEDQLAINNYWKEIGGIQMLPGTNRSSDRFVRASFYIHAIPQTSDEKVAVPSVLSVMRNVSVPFGINTPDKPYISSTRWRTVSDQKNKVYYFESTLTPNLFWLDLKKIDFSTGTSVKKLALTHGEIYAGDAVRDLKDSNPFTFLFQTPEM